MKLRKLTVEEAAQLCACGLKPSQSGHTRGCPHYIAGRRAHWAKCSQRRRDRQKEARTC